MNSTCSRRSFLVKCQDRGDSRWAQHSDLGHSVNILDVSRPVRPYRVKPAVDECFKNDKSIGRSVDVRCSHVWVVKGPIAPKCRSVKDEWGAVTGFYTRLFLTRTNTGVVVLQMYYTTGTHTGGCSRPTPLLQFFFIIFFASKTTKALNLCP